MIDIISLQRCEKNDIGLGKAHQVPHTRPMGLTCRHLEKTRQEKTTTENRQPIQSEAIWQRTAQGRLTRSRHDDSDEAFAQPRDAPIVRLPNDIMMMYHKLVFASRPYSVFQQNRNSYNCVPL